MIKKRVFYTSIQQLFVIGGIAIPRDVFRGKDAATPMTLQKQNATVLKYSTAMRYFCQYVVYTKIFHENLLSRNVLIKYFIYLQPSHIINVFKEKELTRENNVHFLHVNGVKKPVPFYSLDVIISVGYRVKSQRGTQFRIWANSVLKQVLIKGFAVSNKLTEQKYKELSQVVRLLGRTIETHRPLSVGEYESLFGVVADYSYALQTLDKYDYQQLSVEAITAEPKFHATYENAMETIHRLKERFGESPWFGNEKDDSFKSSIGQIYQTFDGQDLYPSVEEKAAMLLYLVVKNHSFTDGNKRIAATLFIWFLHRNGILYAPDGRKRIADNTLVALTLMIAESRPEEKDVMVKVVVNLINQNNG